MASPSVVRIVSINNLRSAADIEAAVNAQLATEASDLVVQDIETNHFNVGGQDLDVVSMTLSPGTGGALAVTAQAGDYVVAVTDEVITIDATAGAAACTLPDPALVPGQLFRVMKIDAGGNAVTVAGAAGTINGGANDSLAAQWNDGAYISDGTNYLKFTG